MGTKEKLAPLTGLLFFIVAIAAFVIGGEPPDIEKPVGEIIDHYSDNDSAIMWGSGLETLAGTFLIFFGGYLYRVLRDASGASGAAALVTFAGTVIVAIGLAIDAMINFALAETVDDIDPTAVQALAALWQNDFFPMALGMQVFLIGLGVSVVRWGALPKWIGWIAIVFGIIAMTPIGFVSFIGGSVLIVIVSVLLTLRARGAAATA